MPPRSQSKPKVSSDNLAFESAFWIAIEDLGSGMEADSDTGNADILRCGIIGSDSFSGRVVLPGGKGSFSRRFRSVSTYPRKIGTLTDGVTIRGELPPAVVDKNLQKLATIKKTLKVLKIVSGSKVCPPPTKASGKNHQPASPGSAVIQNTVPPSLPQSSQRLLIVDEQPLYRRGLANLIQEQKGLTVCAQFSSRRDALDAIPAVRPDMVILELSPRDGAGVALIKDIKLRYPRLRILVISAYAESLYAERVLRAGANGFVSKDDTEAVILEAIHLALSGKTYLSPKLAARLASKFLGGDTLATASPLAAFTDRELQVFRLVGTGDSTRAISEALHLSIKTIETYLEHLKIKLGVSSGVALARRAVQWVETGIMK